MLGGNKWKLNNNSVVEVSVGVVGEGVSGQQRGPVLLTFPLYLQIASLRFVFLINQDLITLIKTEAAKMAQQ